MRFSDVLSLLGGAFAHRVRAVLTLLGVAIGAGSIVLLASLVHGGEQALVQADQEASDQDVVEAHPQETPAAARGKTTHPLSRRDADSLAKSPALGGATVVAEGVHDAWAYFGGRRKRVAMVSANDTTLSLYRLAVHRGRFLDDVDRREASRVCVVGHEVYEELLASPSRPVTDRSGPVGLRLEVEGTLFLVVGILEKKLMIGSTDSTDVWDRKVIVPETTYDTLFAPSHEIEHLYLRKPGARAQAMTPLKAAMRALLFRRHLGVENFKIGNEESGREALILDIIQVLLFTTGLLALLASGVNIMNVMLVTVTERTREIGLRRALGATQRSILVQFLLEAASLALVGGLVGVGGGALFSWGIANLARSAIGRFDLTLPAWSFAVGLGLAVATGLGFGALPAWRAARVSPIDALRSD